MPQELLARVCDAMGDRGADADAFEQIRLLLAADELNFHPGPESPKTPASSRPTHALYAVGARGQVLGWLEVGGAHDSAAVRGVLPAIAQGVLQQREWQRLDRRVAQVEGTAARALELAELVTWLLHARDHAEVEQLGTAALASLLGVDAGAIVSRAADGTWTLRVPSRSLVARRGGRAPRPHRARRPRAR